MPDRSFRHTIVTSPATLPVAGLLTVAAWAALGASSPLAWYGCAATLLTAYLVAEWNNRCALTRIRSRMVSTTFLAFMAAMPFLHAWTTDMIPPACLVLAYTLLFSAYQQPRSSGYVFHAFLFIGLGAIFCNQLLLLAPFMFFILAVQLRASSWRTFFAGLFGLLAPMWFYAGYAIWKQQLDTAFLFLSDIVLLTPPDYSQLASSRIASAAVLLLLVSVGAWHYARNYFRDKIRTRMFMYAIFLLEAPLLLLLVLQPHTFDTTLRLLIANSAPIVAHYFALSEARAAKWLMLASFLLLVVLALFNANASQWMPLLIS